MKLTKEQVMKIADAVRIEISDEEATTYADALTESIQYANILNELNTDDVQPMTHAIQKGNVMRKDEPELNITQEEVLSNAPDHEDGHFKVPSILD